MGQWHCGIGGQQYGPVELVVVRQWLTEGRLRPSDLVWTEGMASWQPAASVPELGAAAGPSFPGAPPPPPAPGPGYPFPTPYARPHRATTVLIFGIVGLVAWIFCAFIGAAFGVAAWVMGNNDLKAMDAGAMDPSGRDTTKTGRILGMVGTFLAIAGLGIGLFMLLARQM